MQINARGQSNEKEPAFNVQQIQTNSTWLMVPVFGWWGIVDVLVSRSTQVRVLTLDDMG
jgi:hypothetical protein